MGALAILIVIDVNRRPETGYTFPALKDIVSMRAIDVSGPQLPEPRSFDIPKQCWGDILAALSPSELDPHDKKMGMIGIMTIQTDSELLFVGLYRKSGDIGEFSIGTVLPTEMHKYYRGGNSDQLERALERVHRESSQPNSATH